jgi:hypothetical protein
MNRNFGVLQGLSGVLPHNLIRANWLMVLMGWVQTCKHLQINPFVYLRDVIERVSTHPARLVLELTPREWKRPRLDSGAQTAA